MTTFNDVFANGITSLQKIASCQVRLYQQPLMELLENIFLDYVSFLNSDTSIERIIESQMIFKNLLESLHAHHRDVRTCYFLIEFNHLLEVSTSSIDLRKAV